MLALPNNRQKQYEYVGAHHIVNVLWQQLDIVCATLDNERRSACWVRLILTSSERGMIHLHMDRRSCTHRLWSCLFSPSSTAAHVCTGNVEEQ